MARPTKQFPIWNPQMRLRLKLSDKNQKIDYASLRNSSSGFTSKKEVRDYIFGRDNYKCVNCESVENLTVDHVVSVYRCSIGEFSINKLNLENNLQTLCNSCNAAKNP